MQKKAKEEEKVVLVELVLTAQGIKYKDWRGVAWRAMDGDNSISSELGRTCRSDGIGCKSKSETPVKVIEIGKDLFLVSRDVLIFAGDWPGSVCYPVLVLYRIRNWQFTLRLLGLLLSDEDILLFNSVCFPSSRGKLT